MLGLKLNHVSKRGPKSSSLMIISQVHIADTEVCVEIRSTRSTKLAHRMMLVDLFLAFCLEFRNVLYNFIDKHFVRVYAYYVTELFVRILGPVWLHSHAKVKVTCHVSPHSANT